jgi:hypothetical protein
MVSGLYTGPASECIIGSCLSHRRLKMHQVWLSRSDYNTPFIAYSCSKIGDHLLAAATYGSVHLAHASGVMQLLTVCIF